MHQKSNDKHAVTFEDTLLHYEVPLVLGARDAFGRFFLGLSFGDDDADGNQHFALVQVDRPTWAEVLRGQVDLRTAMTERCSGLTLTAHGCGAPGESVFAIVVKSLPEAALPAPGMFLPTQPTHSTLEVA